MTLSEANLLIVDDEPILRLTFGLLLRQQGASVYEAANGAEALAILRCRHIHLMLSDRQMPILDGMALLRTMAEEALCVPSILFVNAVDSESQKGLERLGVVKTLAKPIHPEDLIRALTETLERVP